MGMICRGDNLPFLMAVQSCLEDGGITVLVQDTPGFGGGRGVRILTVPHEDHDRALKMLRENGLDPARVDLVRDSSTP